MEINKVSHKRDRRERRRERERERGERQREAERAQQLHDINSLCIRIRFSHYRQISVRQRRRFGVLQLDKHGSRPVLLEQVIRSVFGRPTPSCVWWTVHAVVRQTFLHSHTAHRRAFVLLKKGKKKISELFEATSFTEHPQWWGHDHAVTVALG